jgi:hypothetical protein
LCVRVARGLSQHQRCSNYALTTLCGLCTGPCEWISLSILPSPIPELQHAPLPLKVLWARERVSTPPSSVVFHLDSHLSPSRSWECVNLDSDRGLRVNFPWKMINGGRLFAIVDSQKVISIWPGEGIDAQFHVFRDSQDTHFTPQNRTWEGRKNKCCSRASPHHWWTLPKIASENNHFIAKGWIWALHDVMQSLVYHFNIVLMLCWSLIPNDQLCFSEHLNRIVLHKYRAHWVPTNGNWDLENWIWSPSTFQ